MLDLLKDIRSNCLSLMVTIPVGEYLQLAEDAYKGQGGIRGQRAPIKTKTGLSIRKRMIDDICRGAVLPPIVIGFCVNPPIDHIYQLLESGTDWKEIATGNSSYGLSIIDGMQRTTALQEAIDNDLSVLEKPIRIEIWIGESVNSLIYRMLILNTGQVPWELSRQLETIYHQFLNRIRRTVPNIDIFLKDDRRRRSTGGQYQSSSIIELFLLFSSRRIEIDIKDRVAEDFARIDAIESSAHRDFMDIFVSTLKYMAKLDHAFSKLENLPTIDGEEARRFDSGKAIFASFPAMVGFCVAAAVTIFDEPGFDVRWDEVPRRLTTIEHAVDSLCTKIDQLSQPELVEFMQLDLLEERLKQRSGQVGRFEREFFRRAFSSMVRNVDRLESMKPCWVT